MKIFNWLIGEEIGELRQMLSNLNLNETHDELISQIKNLENEIKFVKDQNIALSTQLLKEEMKNLEDSLRSEEANIFDLDRTGI